MDYSLLLTLETVYIPRRDLIAIQGDIYNSRNKLLTIALPPSADMPVDSQLSSHNTQSMARDMSSANKGGTTRFVVHIGIIDYLQAWDLKKKLEHSAKTMFNRNGKQTISSVSPGFYSQRFNNFINKEVFCEFDYNNLYTDIL